jgi:dihydrofolate reductase
VSISEAPARVEGVDIEIEEDTMAKLVLFVSVSLDGVMQGPGRPDEDTRDGFAHGGWAAPYADAGTGAAAAEGGATSGAILLGRRTYLDFFSVWPHRTDNPFTEVLNNTQKYVVSRSLTDDLPWQNSSLLRGVADVAAVKQRLDRDIVLLGSGELARSLMDAGLIDTYTLLIHPLVLGSGTRLFPPACPDRKLDLVRSTATSSGVVIATYQPAA